LAENGHLLEQGNLDKECVFERRKFRKNLNCDKNSSKSITAAFELMWRSELMKMVYQYRLQF